ncbi:hypothetical protein D3C85_1555600 [compost metagenome]
MPNSHHGEELQRIAQVLQCFGRHDISASDCIDTIKRVLRRTAASKSMDTNKVGERCGTATFQIDDSFLLAICLNDKGTKKSQGRCPVERDPRHGIEESWM